MRVPATYHSFGLGGEDKVCDPGEVPFEWPGIDYLSGTNNEPWELATLSSTMRRLNHEHVTFLKVDVEGSEWAALPDIMDASWSQLMIELHFPPGTHRLESLPSGGARVVQITDTDRLHGSSRLVLLAQLAKIATLWKIEFNGAHCLELSYVRRTGAHPPSVWSKLLSMARSVASVLHDPLKKLLGAP